MRVITNPDKEFVTEIRTKIKENNGHCACTTVFNDDTKCICKNFRDQIERKEPGECHCGLYRIIND